MRPTEELLALSLVLSFFPKYTSIRAYEALLQELLLLPVRHVSWAYLRNKLHLVPDVTWYRIILSTRARLSEIIS